MFTASPNEIDISELQKAFPENKDGSLSEDLFISEVTRSEMLDKLKYPCRFNGYMAIFCLKGSFSVEINLKTYEISENSVIISVPGNIGRIYSAGNLNDEIRLCVVAVSEQFLSGARLDFARLFDESIALLSNPCFSINNAQLEIFNEYFSLINKLLAQPADAIFGALTAAVAAFGVSVAVLYLVRQVGGEDVQLESVILQDVLSCIC